MEDEFDEVEELAAQFMQQADTGMPVYMDLEELMDVIVYFLEEFDDECKTYARKALDIALSLYPTDPYLRVLNANYYARENDYSLADSELDYAEFNLQPIAELYVARVRLAQWKGEAIDAIPLLKKALKMDPELVDAHIFIALEYVRIFKINEAVGHALAACRLNEEASIDELFFGSVLDFEHHPQFVQFFEAMTEKMPMTAGWWNALGKINTYMGRFEKAMEAFKFLIALEENNYDAYWHLGETQYALKQYEEAIQNYEIAQHKDDTETDYYDMICRCHIGLHNYEAALHCLSLHDFGDYGEEKSIEDEELLLFVADELAKSGRFDEARTLLRNQIAKNFFSYNLKVGLIDLLSPDMDREEICNLCDSVLDSQKMDDGEKGIFLVSFIRYCYVNNATELGVEICELFYERQVVDESCFYYMALLYVRAMMIEKACSYLERALQAVPQMVGPDFLAFEPEIENIPEIRELLDIYDLSNEELN